MRPIDEVLQFTRPLNVLYVEDDPGLRRETLEFLEDFFHRVDVASDGREGLDRYQDYLNRNARPYDLVITDLNMPRMSGEEMIRNIRKHVPEQGLIVISAHTESERLLELIGLGIRNFILKPMQPDQTLDMLQRAAKDVVSHKILEQHYQNLEEMNERLEDSLDEKVRELEVLNQNLEATIRKQTDSLKHLNNELNLLFDLIPNITLITSGQRILRANDRFFDFAGYPDIEAFRKDHDCICDLFVEREGYLKPSMGGLTWTEYILSRPKTIHRAILQQNGQEKVFTVDVVPFPIQDMTEYIAVFDDITEINLLASTDRLTGLDNRAKIDEVLQERLFDYERNKRDFSIVIIDIDHFKKVNDTYGHIVGDTVLKKLASLLRENTRKLDHVGRWGGEEFIIICNGSDLQGTRILAQHLREKVAAEPFDFVHHITASFGVAQYEEGIPLNELFRRADTALYRAKNNGRNQVTVYLPE